MNFKMLAIRPLEGCSNKLLKSLKVNCIYRFYNEYEFLNGDNINVNDKTYIKIEKNETESYFTGYKEINVDKIKYKKQIPDDFYGSNINISAIVGENGSGKSSLLELIYYFLFDYSVFEKIISDDKENIKIHLNNFKFEFYCLYNNKIFRFLYSSDKEIEVSEFKNQGDFFEINNNDLNINEFGDLDFFSESFRYLDINKRQVLPFYNIVSNYGLYGLNSKLDGNSWINYIIHKNDGYQTPIVINPFRKHGNIDINREYILSYQRLIINHYVIGNKELLANISLDNIKYSVNVLKHQFFNYNVDVDYNKLIQNLLNPDKNISEISTNEIGILLNNGNELVVNSFKIFLNQNFGEDGLEGFFKELFIDKNIYLDIDNLIKYWNENVLITKNFIINNENEVLGKVELEYLNLLYIFRKLKKITTIYADYDRFEYIFDEVDIEKINQLKQIQIDYFVTRKISYSPKERFNENIHNWIEETFYVFEKSILGKNKKSILGIPNKNYIQEVINKSYSSNPKEFAENLAENLLSIINTRKREDFVRYINRLNTTKTHVEFKIKQAISYFENNTFSSLFDDYKNNRNLKTGYYDFEVNENYFSQSEKDNKNFDIESVPIAFFELDIVLSKKGQKESYPFSNLSSGEQQMINSLLTISYHLFNLGSNLSSEFNKIKYKNINIIMDEIELYFHPNYQKKYVEELIRSLSYFKEYSFNIIFSTHSPFILSDIPSQNILKLKNGVPFDFKDNINSFGSNIHDILADEFFMGDGFMGEFATKKIKEIFDKLNEKDSNISKQEYESLLKEINLIGETVIKQPLLDLLHKKFKNSFSDTELLIKYYERKIKELTK